MVKSIKTKIACLVGALMVIALLGIGLITFFVTRSNTLELAAHTQANNVKMADAIIADFMTTNFKATQDLGNMILEMPYEKLATQEAVMENVGPLLRSFRIGGNFMSAGIGRENGELIVSDTESDKEKSAIIPMVKHITMMCERVIGILKPKNKMAYTLALLMRIL